MDLLAPCRSCLQCLPFFHVSPPPPPRPAAAPPPSSSQSPDVSKAIAADPSQSSEISPSPPAAPAVQEQDPCLPIKVEEEHQATGSDNDEALQKLEGEYSAATESEAVPVSGIVIAPPVSSPTSGAPLPEDTDDNNCVTPPELPLQVPFINDITFSASGFMPPQAPITPALFGPSYTAGEELPHNQIHQDQQLGHAHSHHGDETSQHGYEHSHHAHNNSHDTHVPQHSQVPSAPYYEVLPPDNSQGSHELHKDASRHNSHHNSHGSAFGDDVTASVTGHTALHDDCYDKVEGISPTPPLEASLSTPDLDMETKTGAENSAVNDTNGTIALLETYHSEPVVLSGDLHDDDYEAHDEVMAHSESHQSARRRRRGHFRDHFKGIKQQIKQGGHHLKEEGSKHMQTIIENINKQAQQIEQSGSFFIVPRANNN